MWIAVKSFGEEGSEKAPRQKLVRIHLMSDVRSLVSVGFDSTSTPAYPGADPPTGVSWISLAKNLGHLFATKVPCCQGAIASQCDREVFQRLRRSRFTMPEYRERELQFLLLV